MEAWIRALNCESMAQLMTAIKNTQLEVTQTDCMGFFSHTRLFALKAIKRGILSETFYDTAHCFTENVSYIYICNLFYKYIIYALFIFLQ